MMRNLSFLLLLLLPLAACINSATRSQPDHRIAVIEDPEQKGKAVAIAKKCPNWKQELGDTLENSYLNHFGCSQMYNLSKMVDNPRDLVRGRELNPADSAAGVLGIERYRQDKKKILINPKDIESTTK